MKSKIKVIVVSYFDDMTYRNNVVELEIPAESAVLIKKAWADESKPIPVSAKYLAVNQSASVKLILEDEVVAGISEMCVSEMQDDRFIRIFDDEE